MARQQRQVDGGLAALASIAGDRAIVIGDRFGLADIVTGTLLGYLTVRFANPPCARDIRTWPR